MVRQINGSSGPVNSSRITKPVPAASGVSVNVRTPRSGTASDQIVNVPPGSIRPSMRRMPVPAPTSRSASVSACQTVAGSASMCRRAS